MASPVPQIQALERSFARDLPAFRVGDTVKVHYLIQEGDKERVQVFEGVVIRRARGGAGATFTVRKVSFGVGVERIFPTNSPRIQRLEIINRGHVRRSRLYYLRQLRGKKARLRATQRQLEDAATATNAVDKPEQ
jgi:large subunit ribosomal protein L19